MSQVYIGKKTLGRLSSRFRESYIREIPGIYEMLFHFIGPETQITEGPVYINRLAGRTDKHFVIHPRTNKRNIRSDI